jgi:serine/threonine protein kinase
MRVFHLERSHGRLCPYFSGGFLMQNARVRKLIFIIKHSGAALTALQSIHQAGILHGDIRPANILVSDCGGITIIDFGHSSRSNNKMAKMEEFKQLQYLLQQS